MTAAISERPIAELFRESARACARSLAPPPRSHRGITARAKSHLRFCRVRVSVTARFLRRRNSQVSDFIEKDKSVWILNGHAG